MNIGEILLNAKVIGVVGCSGRPTRTSNRITQYLMSHGFTVVPVNPHYDEVLGEVCYPNLAAVPRDVQIDIVNIFRNPRHTAEMVEDAVGRAQETATRPVIWTQLGVSTPQAREIAERADLPYVANRCIMVEHSHAV